LPVIVDFDKEQISSITEFSIENNTSLRYYPNPTSEKIFFDQSIKNISVFNISGSLAFRHLGVTDQLDVSKLQSGYYTAAVTLLNDQIEIVKLIVN